MVGTVGETGDSLGTTRISLVKLYMDFSKVTFKAQTEFDHSQRIVIQIECLNELCFRII